MLGRKNRKGWKSRESTCCSVLLSDSIDFSAFFWSLIRTVRRHLLEQLWSWSVVCQWVRTQGEREVISIFSVSSLLKETVYLVAGAGVTKMAIRGCRESNTHTYSIYIWLKYTHKIVFIHFSILWLCYITCHRVENHQLFW